nr:unnamed protein product [Callosobruchus analis]
MPLLRTIPKKFNSQICFNFLFFNCLHYSILKQKLWKLIAKQFEDKWNFTPTPIHSVSEFYNYKSFFSIVLFAAVDANYTSVNGSDFKKCQNDNTVLIPPLRTLPGRNMAVPYVFLGEEAFSLSLNVMKSFSGTHDKLSYISQRPEMYIGEVIKAKWQNLRDHCRREHAKISKVPTGSAVLDATQISARKHYKQLLFLTDAFSSRKMKTNIPPVSSQTSELGDILNEEGEEEEGVIASDIISDPDRAASNNIVAIQETENVVDVDETNLLPSHSPKSFRKPIMAIKRKTGKPNALMKLFALEQKKVEQLEKRYERSNVSEDLNKNEDYHFLMSLLPHLRDIPKRKKLTHISLPTIEEWKNIALDFYNKWNFPNCIGCIDGKHIRIKCPKKTGSTFFNYKSYFSIVLQGIADANYKFLAVEVGAYGRQSDGGTFSDSNIYQRLEAKTLNIPGNENIPSTNIPAPYVLLGDDAYPLKTYLLKPYSRQRLGIEERIFNYRLSRARRCVECAFGILVAKWRCLKTELQIAPDKVDIIVKCVCLFA